MIINSEKKLGESYKTFFVNDDIINCPVTKCEVLQKGCQAPFSTTELNYFSILEEDDFAL
jgi:hypothetical protein